MSDRPNILFIITDQQYAGAMRCAGNPDLHTPAMDSLAEQGIRFEKAYCTQPLCCPVRSSFMTGLMPHQTGVIGNSEPLLPDLVGRSLADLFRAGGYDCAYAGKWHVPGVTPEDLGFDVLCGNGDAEVPRRCIDFLKQDRDNPFLMVASFINPHDICPWARNQPLPQGPIADAPTEACPNLPANFAVAPFAPDALEFVRSAHRGIYPAATYSDDDWRHLRHGYFRLVEKVDAEIGALLDGLRAQGLEEDTLIVFTSDHGDGHGAHHWNQKTALYEECVRVPFIVTQKGVTQAGAVDDSHLVSSGLDLLPTLCDCAGIDTPDGLPGQSVRPLAEGRQPSVWRDQVAIETRLDYAGMPGTAQSMARAVRTDRYKYSVYPIGRYREQLIDLQEDPGEMVNLAVQANCRDILNDHRKRLLDWCRETDDPFVSLCVE